MAKLTLKLDTRKANKAGGVSHQTVADPYAGCRKYLHRGVKKGEAVELVDWTQRTAGAVREKRKPGQ